MGQEISSIEDLLKKTGAKDPTAGVAVPATATAAPAQAPLPGDESTEEKFESKMENIRLAEKERETERAAVTAGLPYVNLKGFAISPEALALIPRAQSEQYKIIAFLHIGEELRIGAVDPTNEQVKEIAFQVGERNRSNVKLYKISEQSYGIANRLYNALPKIKVIVKGVQITPEELKRYREQIKNFHDVKKMLGEATVTDIMSILTAAALELGTSDIHIEAEEKGIMVRFRIDGELQEIAELPRELWKKIIARIKLISGLKINITEKPQDGRMTIFLEEGKSDVRVSTLPTTWGESVVMRILNPGATKVGFNDLGFRDLAYKKLEREISKPHGMVITTGPTGSGKTTTLYSILRQLNKPGVKIITLEDPVEYKVEGLNQSQIDHAKHYSFADGLRSILRQDPDIVMVGEIRDLETAETAINAALTGHLMLSTIHTNDAAGAIPRFIAMGVKPFLLAPALNAILGQRLVRKICEKCKVEDQPDEATLERVKAILAEVPAKSGEKVPALEEVKFYKGGGCEVCNKTGFKGRIGIYEVLTMDAEVEKAMREGSVSEYQMREIAKNQGMVTMVQDGVLKAVDGITSISEVFRVAAE
ncbi:MAG: GspE/PulE family protein [Candidatus Uhrbacteria bacterium]|nr:GspE/PulE family protein [Patescibacteria group bacterium]MBU1906890.1 GspE/PulE family protein [Patescibacteria group bacterium]